MPRVAIRCRFRDSSFPFDGISKLQRQNSFRKSASLFKQTVKNFGLKFMIQKLFSLFLFLFLWSCQNKSASDEERNNLLIGALLSRGGGGTAVAASSITCTNASPAFATLAQAGVNSSCARSGCHSGASPQSGLDMTNYNSVIRYVTARNASSSALYSKINGGTMTQYSNQQINTAVFCWIQGGALP